MGCKKNIRDFLKRIDIFSTKELLRFKGDSSYSTVTGGIMTFIIFLGFLAAFITNSISVFKRQTIISKDRIQYQGQPSQFNLTIGQGSMMFAIGLQGYNLTLKDKRYFDIFLTSKTKSFGTNISKIKSIQLQPCKRQIWSNISQLAEKSYDTQQYSRFLCPKQGTLLTLQGKYSSQWFKYLKVEVNKCNKTLDLSRPCDQQLLKADNFSNWVIEFNFINAYINTADSQPVKYYLQDRNYIPFIILSSVISDIYVTQQVIQTDISIMPWQKKQKISVPVVRQPGFIKSSGLWIDNYVNLYIRKSPYTVYSSRSYEKIADYFSFLGGLFGFITFGFFMFQYFNTAAFQVDIADKLFYFSPDEPLQPKKYGFLNYLTESIYRFLSQIGCSFDWKISQKYTKCRDQVNEQLDVALLLNKIAFFQTCMSILFQQHQFRSIFLQQKPTVKQAQNLRINHGLNKLIHQNFTKSSKIFYDQKITNATNIIGKQFVKEIDIINKANDMVYSKTQNFPKPLGSNGQKKQQPDLFKILGQIMTSPDNLGKSPFDNPRQQQMNNNMVKSLKLKELKKLGKDLQQIGGSYEDRLNFFNTAINDIKQIEEEAKNGNEISRRIYNRLNNDSTKQKFIFVTYLQKLKNDIDAVKIQKSRIEQQNFSPTRFIGNIFNGNNKEKEIRASQKNLQPLQSNVRFRSLPNVKS